MALYIYVKAQPKSYFPPTSRWRLPRFVNGKTLSLLCVFLGLAFILNAGLPIVFYETSSYRFKNQLISPVEVLGESTTSIDYSRPESWFPSAPMPSVSPSKITHYTLSIPKLGIKEATVEIGGKDLMKSLIQYPGTALPGQYGNTVIYGHSVLPQFFDPKNYKTIFSTLPTLEEGDEIFINFDGIDYLYKVTSMFEVSPDEIAVLEQRFDGEYLSLITCVPPGTYLRRLVVRAHLVKI